MRLASPIFLLLLAACGAESSPSSSDSSTPPSAQGPATKNPDPGSSKNPSPNVAPGAIDPSCGTSGYFDVNGSLSGLERESAGTVLVTTSNAIQRIDEAGKMAKVAAYGSTGLVLGGDGKYYGISPASAGVAANVFRYAADFSVDSSFAFDKYKWPTTGITAIAVTADGHVYVAGTLAQNTGDDHIAVRRFDATGKLDASFAPADDAMPKDMRPRSLLLASDGGILVGTDQGFTPGILRLTTTGALDDGFGTAGYRGLTELGPRDLRKTLLDDQGRILVLGMENDALQIVRLSATGALDASFGKAGVAELDLDELPLSADYDEHVEARDMFLDASGRIVVAADYEYGKDTFNPETQTLRLVRFDGSGKLDASFGDKGIAKIDFGAGTKSRLLDRAAAAGLGDHRLLVGGTKQVGTTSTYAIACVEM